MPLFQIERKVLIQEISKLFLLRTIDKNVLAVYYKSILLHIFLDWIVGGSMKDKAIGKIVLGWFLIVLGIVIFGGAAFYGYNEVYNLKTSSDLMSFLFIFGECTSCNYPNN